MAALTFKDLEHIKEKKLKEITLQSGTDTVRILVHAGTCGLAAGADKVIEVFKEEIQKSQRQDIKLVLSGCFGMCSSEPNVTIEKKGEDPVVYQFVDGPMTREIFTKHVLQGEVPKKCVLCRRVDDRKALEGEIPTMMDLPFFAHQTLWVMRNKAMVDPEEIDDYIAQDGYFAAYKAIKEMKPEQIVHEVKTSGLRGRGGGGFPTGLKWEFASKNVSDIKYVLCNADEGDPGAFMDRSVLEADPHAVLEGMIIAARAINAHNGYIYCRTEYPLAIKRLNLAIEQAKKYGLLGKDILGTGFDFDLEIYEGAGAFVCGEETALMHSIEGKRGTPRPRPPFPAQQGLWKQPSILNNVETFANIPQIIIKGGAWYASVGTANSKGTKVFALTGKVNNIGLVEVPMGIPLRSIIYDIGGGIPAKKKFKAVQLGGPSGGCVPEQFIDIPVDYEEIVKVGAIMGSGGAIVMDENTCMVDMARFFLDFIQDESCGKCTPCREGTRRQLEILNKICEGKGEINDLKVLEELSVVIKDSSLCGLGQTAPNPVLSTLRYFRDEYEAHINEKRCPAKRCVALLKFEVDPNACKKCGLCFSACPANAITWKKKEVAIINKELCIKCMTCFEKCKFDAIF
ncbi:MAG: NADH-quinone oxidoreductase subunit NuoF [Desulfobacterales bacterium]|nr:NADH-quinone oxidoreductase subunit NuoF [Desulfobacterales bacterium]